MLGMIGLEGSGFTICLGLILLLTGIVMYYSKTKITQCEHKVDTMFSLVTSLNDEVTLLRNTVSNLTQQLGNQNHIYHDKKELADESEDETDDETDDDDNNNGNVDGTQNLYSNHPYRELIPATIAEVDDDSASSQSEDDSDENDNIDNNNINNNVDNNNKNTLLNIDDNAQTDGDIKVVELGEIEDLVVESDDDNNEETGSETSNQTSDDSEEEQIDYTKLQVVALKRLASERKLASNVNKLRKAELIALLQGS
jgi:hypothetical protein